MRKLRRVTVHHNIPPTVKCWNVEMSQAGMDGWIKSLPPLFTLHPQPTTSPLPLFHTHLYSLTYSHYHNSLNSVMRKLRRITVHHNIPPTVKCWNVEKCWNVPGRQAWMDAKQNGRWDIATDSLKGALSKVLLLRFTVYLWCNGRGRVAFWADPPPPGISCSRWEDGRFMANHLMKKDSEGCSVCAGGTCSNNACIIDSRTYRYRP